MQTNLSLSSSSLHNPLAPLSKPPFLAGRTTHRHRLAVVSATGSREQQQQHRRPPAAVVGTMYELLSVAETARPEEIKAAYRRQARLWHPDVCPSAGDRGFFAQQFMRAREAYEVLSDPALREGYDLALRTGVPPESWAAAVHGGAVFRKGTGRDGAGFGDWESQLEGLKRRRDRRSPTTWGSRMRSVNESGPSD